MTFKIEDFEEYFVSRHRFTPVFSVNSGGFVNLNAAFVRKHLNNEKPKWARILYNKNTCEMGVVFVDDGKSGYARVKSIDNGGVAINARRLFAEHGLTIKKGKGDIKVRKTKIGDMFVLDLKWVT